MTKILVKISDVSTVVKAQVRIDVPVEPRLFILLVEYGIQNLLYDSLELVYSNNYTLNTKHHCILICAEPNRLEVITPYSKVKTILTIKRILADENFDLSLSLMHPLKAEYS